MITYNVKARLAKNLGTDDFCFEIFEKEFRNQDNPIEARKQAFQYYFSLIHIIGDESDDYDSIQKNIDLGKKYLSNSPYLKDKESKLHKYLQFGEKGVVIPGGELGIVVYFKLDPDDDYYNDIDEEGAMIAGNKNAFDDYDVVMNLFYEYETYLEKNWNTEGQTMTIKYWDNLDDQWYTQENLWTSFDFIAFANKTSNSHDAETELVQPNENEEIVPLKSIIEEIKKGRENQNLEFKSTLRVNLHTGEIDKRMQHASLKTINGFLNSKEGGHLVIGVDDDGKALGVSNDKFENEDKMDLHLGNLIKSQLGVSSMLHIKAHFEDYCEERVLIVDCKPSKVPVYLKNGGDEEFYIRAGNSTEKLNPSQMTVYIKQRFN